MSTLELSLLTLAAFGATAVGTGWLRRWLIKRSIIDHPGEEGGRYIHEVPTPRGGGLAIYAVLVAAWATIMTKSPNTPIGTGWILVCSVGLAIPAWIDDLGIVNSVRGHVNGDAVVHFPDVRAIHTRDFFVLLQLFWQVVIASIGTFFLTGPLPIFQGLLPTALDTSATVFLWVGFINLFNFTDGIDGNAGTKAVVLGVGIFALSIFGEFPSGLGELGIITAAIALGFLVWNWYPARIFMGDIGSIPLGFLLGWLLLSLAGRGQWAPALILPLIYLSDSGLTYMAKITRGEKFWRGHRDLFYQRAAHCTEATHADIVKVILLGDIVLLGLAIFATQGMIALSLIGAIATSAAVIAYLRFGFRQ